MINALDSVATVPQLLVLIFRRRVLKSVSSSSAQKQLLNMPDHQ